MQIFKLSKYIIVIVILFKIFLFCKKKKNLTNSSKIFKEIQKLGKVLKIRQRGISTALVYFRRFYQKQNFCHFSPSLVAPTCMFLASKAEEFSIKASASQIISRMKEIG